MGKKFYLISLGCARNRVDSEIILGLLSKSGYSYVDDPESADIIIINTCSFIDDAKKESIDVILEAAEYKTKDPSKKIVVSGCLPQRYKKELLDTLPEVDLFIGTDEYVKIVDLLSQSQNKLFISRSDYIYNDIKYERVNTLNKFSAYLKVSEGCQHNCSFCVIPKIRGPLKSRPLELILKEAEDLINSGVIELNLIAQDLAAYGRDGKEHNLNDLLLGLTGLSGAKWIRLLYVYPENIDDKLLDIIKSSHNIVKYLDIPIQHGSSSVLKRMKRSIDAKGLRIILGKLRDYIPEISIRTSVMVGFPGETEEEFKELYDFIKTQQFDHLGCFKFSLQEETPAAKLDNQINEQIKERRFNEIMMLQQEISKNKLKAKIGKTFEALIEGISDETDLLFKGRLKSQAPEVDGVLYINDGKPAPGLQQVLITDTHDYDLIGKALEPY